MKTDLTNCLYRFDCPADPEAVEARLWPADKQMLQCVIRSRVNTDLNNEGWFVSIKIFGSGTWVRSNTSMFFHTQKGFVLLMR
jgi:hypothetical protein